MLDRSARWAPLTGVVFAVLTVVAIVLSKTSPGANSSGQRVISFYEAHASSQRATDLLFGLAFIFLLFFAGSLRGYLRRTAAAEGLAALMLAGAVLLAVGIAAFSGIDFTLADVRGHLDPAGAQALNALDSDFFFPVAMGGCVFGIAAGLAILRGAPLPKWLGWAAVVIGVATATPASFVALFAFVVWTVIVSVLVFRRSAAAEPAPLAGTPTPVGAASG